MENINCEELKIFRKKHKKLSNVPRILEKYEEDQDYREIINQIRDIVSKMDYDNSYTGKDGKGRDVDVKDITVLLLFEYVMSLEEMTKNMPNGYSHDEVLEQLTGVMGRFRLGKLNLEKDRDVKIYAKTRDEQLEPPKYVLDIQEGIVEGKLASAQCYSYYEHDENGNKIDFKKLVALYETLQKEPNLNRIRQVIFHEWNHCMEITRKKEAEKMFDDVGNDTTKKYDYYRVRSDGNIFFSGGKKYLNYTVLDDDLGIIYTGIATREKVPITERNREGIIMHNQITEGTVEYISREIMKTLGVEEDIDYGKYAGHVRVTQKVAEKYGKVEYITQFLRDSSELIKQFEEIQINGEDGLHYLSRYATQLYEGDTEVQRATRPFKSLAEKTQMTEKEIENVQTFRVWSESTLTEDMKKVIFNIFLNQNPTQEEIEEIRVAIEDYEASLKHEGEFISKFTDRMHKPYVATYSMKSLVENALENHQIGAIEVGNSDRVKKATEEKSVTGVEFYE